MKRLQAALIVAMVACVGLSCLLLNERQFRLIAEDRAEHAEASSRALSDELLQFMADYHYSKRMACST